MREPFIQTNKLRLGVMDQSLAISGVPLPTGLLCNSGVSIFGASPQAGAARACVMMGPAIGLSAPATLEVIGIGNYIGISNFYGKINQYGFKEAYGVTRKVALSLKDGVDLKNSVEITNAPDLDNANLTVAGTINCAWLEGRLAAAMMSPPKGFDMHHPTKRGWRLSHISIEGPEAAVYHRGILDSGNIIKLPEYWNGLVRSETITVQLTSIGVYQELSYEVIDGTTIKVKNNVGAPIKCSYVAFGERKDVDKIVVEYPGKIEDYPGRDQRSIVGYHYDVRKGVNG